MTALLEAVSFLVGWILSAYAMLLGLRFIMQLFRADYYNPLAQFVVKVTDPALVRVRKFVPSIKKYDVSSLLLAFVVIIVKLLVLKALQTERIGVAGEYLPSGMLTFGVLPLIGFVDLINLLFNIFIFALFIQALLSWFPNPQTDAIRNLLSGITEPIVRPIRNRVPPVAGLDLSILIAILALFFLQILVIGILMSPFVLR